MLQLHLHPLTEKGITNKQWYARRPVGFHTIEKFMKEIKQQIGTSGKFTPHSLRATTATRLYEHGVDEQLIQEHTGHTRNAVRSYKRNFSSMKEVVSNLIRPSFKPEDTKWVPKLSATDKNFYLSISFIM